MDEPLNMAGGAVGTPVANFWRRLEDEASLIPTRGVVVCDQLVVSGKTVTVGPQTNKPRFTANTRKDIP